MKILQTGSGPFERLLDILNQDSKVLIGFVSVRDHFSHLPVRFNLVYKRDLAPSMDGPSSSTVVASSPLTLSTHTLPQSPFLVRTPSTEDVSGVDPILRC